MTSTPGLAPVPRTSERSVPTTCTSHCCSRSPGVGHVLAYTIASEIGDIGRFSSPKKLTGYTGLCPRVYQSGERDVRGPLAKNGL